METVRSFPSFTQDLHALADWLQQGRVDTVAMESTGVYWPEKSSDELPDWVSNKQKRLKRIRQGQSRTRSGRQKRQPNGNRIPTKRVIKPNPPERHRISSSEI
jgi:hypothetical protein